jgi:acylphosphatase
VVGFFAIYRLLSTLNCRSDTDPLISSWAEMSNGMKSRIVIEGPKVHNVGYRYFLMTLARRARIRYFDADNIEGAVEVLVESDEGKIAAFKKMVETSRPDRAEVSKISYEDYDGEIWPISEYSQFCTNLQMNKAIPILLDVVDILKNIKEDTASVKKDTSSMLEKQDATISILKDVKEDTSSMLDKQDETIEAIRDLKRDNERFIRIEKDIKTIKSKIGVR